MKKIILLGALAVTLLTTGCTLPSINKKTINLKINSSKEKADSLKEAYFDISKKDDELAIIDEEYLNKLLDGYEYDEDMSIKDENNVFAYKLDAYKNENEKLLIGRSTGENERTLELNYEVVKGEDKISLGYTPKNSDSDRYLANITLGDTKLFKELSKTLDLADTDFLTIYNEIAEKLLDNKEININEAKELINLEPIGGESTDPNSASQIRSYSFTNDIETITIDCISGQEKISRVSYSNNERFFLKNVIGSELLLDGQNILCNITTNVDSIDVQKSVADLFKK